MSSISVGNGSHREKVMSSVIGNQDIFLCLYLLVIKYLKNAMSMTYSNYDYDNAGLITFHQFASVPCGSRNLCNLKLWCHWTLYVPTIALITLIAWFGNTAASGKYVYETVLCYSQRMNTLKMMSGPTRKVSYTLEKSRHSSVWFAGNKYKVHKIWLTFLGF